MEIDEFEYDQSYNNREKRAIGDMHITEREPRQTRGSVNSQYSSQSRNSSNINIRGNSSHNVGN
jgi:hypothetical protein